MVLKPDFPTKQEALSVSPVSRKLDRVKVVFDELSLVANAGLILVATLVIGLGLETRFGDSDQHHREDEGPGRWGLGRVARC